MRVRALVVCSVGLLAACSGKSSSTSPTAPTPPPTPVVTVSSVAVSGDTAFTAPGATAQFKALATLSSGATEDRTASAQWTSDNPSVATVSAGGLVTAVADGDATISATVSPAKGTRGVTVRIPRRAADPAPGQRLPLPDIRAFVEQASAARPELLAQSCPGGVKYRNNPWLDYIVDQLRTLDTRWGYNAKPTRNASQNGGIPVIASGDEVAYHYGAGPDQGSPDVYLIDLLEGHCGATPRVTYRNFTGEEPGIWTNLGRF